MMAPMSDHGNEASSCIWLAPKHTIAPQNRVQTPIIMETMASSSSSSPGGASLNTSGHMP